jgi:hypothetical protein
MKVQILSPTVQHGEEAQFHTQALGVPGNSQQRFGGDAEQQVVERLFVVEGDRGHLLGQREDHVEIHGRQQFGAPLLEPFVAGRALALRTMAVSAGAVFCMCELAALTPFDYPAQNGGATGLYGPHEFQLLQR